MGFRETMMDRLSFRQNSLRSNAWIFISSLMFFISGLAHLYHNNRDRLGWTMILAALINSGSVVSCWPNRRTLIDSFGWTALDILMGVGGFLLLAFTVCGLIFRQSISSVLLIAVVAGGAMILGVLRHRADSPRNH